MKENTMQLRITDSKQGISNQAWIYKPRQRLKLQHEFFSLDYVSNKHFKGHFNVYMWVESSSLSRT